MRWTIKLLNAPLKKNNAVNKVKHSNKKKTWGKLLN